MLTIILNNQDKLHGFVNIISAMVELESESKKKIDIHQSRQDLSKSLLQTRNVLVKVIYGRLSGGNIYIFSSMQTLYALASTLINAFGS